MSTLLYVLALEPLLCGIRDEKVSPALRGIPLAGRLSAKVSTYVDEIIVCGSRCLDIKAVKKAVARYEMMAEAKINFDKSEILQLGAWRGCVSLPGPFRWSDGPILILRVWVGTGLQWKRNCWEVKAKVDAQVGMWLRRRLSLKGKVKMCAVYIFR